MTMTHRKPIPNVFVTPFFFFMTQIFIFLISVLLIDTFSILVNKTESQKKSKASIFGTTHFVSRYYYNPETTENYITNLKQQKDNI